MRSSRSSEQLAVIELGYTEKPREVWSAKAHQAVEDGRVKGT